MNDIAYLLESTRPPIEPFEPEWSAQTLVSIMSTPSESPRRIRRRPVARIIALTAGVAAAAMVAVSVTSVGSSPAFAVEQDSGGDLVVTVHRFTDSAGLENALGQNGINAEVTYVEVEKSSDLSNDPGSQCAAGEYVGATVDPTDDGGFSVTFDEAYLDAHKGAELRMVAAGGRSSNDFAGVAIIWSDGLC